MLRRGVEQLPQLLRLLGENVGRPANTLLQNTWSEPQADIGGRFHDAERDQSRRHPKKQPAARRRRSGQLRHRYTSNQSLPINHRTPRVHLGVGHGVPAAAARRSKPQAGPPTPIRQANGDSGDGRTTNPCPLRDTV